MTSQEPRSNSKSSPRSTKFLIDQVQVDRSTNILAGPNGEVRLEPRVMEILCQLSDAAGEVVLREDMLDEHGSDEGVTRAVSILRKSFKVVADDRKVIETIPKRGYRLISNVLNGSTQTSVESDTADASDDHLASLAVLSFADLSENQDQGYLSDGVSQEIMHALAKLPFLRVAGRTSSFSFKGSNAKVAHIASQLNVSHILDGAVRKYGDRLRITAQLVEAKLDKQVWSETVDGTEDDLFDLQDKIARSVEATLQNLFGVAPSAEPNTFRLASKLTDSKEAYSEFLIGRHLMYELSGQRTIPRAIAAFENAVENDPKFASAWAHLAIANFTLPEYSATSDWREHITAARTQAEHALSLSKDIAWSHRARAGILSYDHKFDEAVLAYQEALKLEPNNPEVLFANGYIFAAVGLQSQAQDMMSRGLDREPFLGSWYAALGTTYFAEGNLDRAEALFKKSFQCNFGYGAVLLAQLLTHRGRSDEAVSFMNDNFDGLGPVMQAQLKSPLVRSLTYSAFFKRSKLARKLMDIILTRRMNDESVQPSLGNVLGFVLIGSPEKFFQHVLKKPNPYVGFALSRIWEPTIEAKAVRQHPEFPKFVDSLGLVRVWQRFGWPESIIPHEGTDGSNGNFTCR